MSKVDIHILFFTSTTNSQSPGDVALWFNSPNPFLIHLAGPNGNYSLGVKENYYPSAGLQFRKPITVGSGKSVTKEQIVSIVSQIPVNNSRSFNSRQFVGDALKRLTEERYLEREEYMRSVGEMIDVTEGHNGRA